MRELIFELLRVWLLDKEVKNIILESQWFVKHNGIEFVMARIEFVGNANDVIFFHRMEVVEKKKQGNKNIVTLAIKRTDLYILKQLANCNEYEKSLMN